MKLFLIIAGLCVMLAAVRYAITPLPEYKPAHVCEEGETIVVASYPDKSWHCWCMKGKRYANLARDCDLGKTQ